MDGLIKNLSLSVSKGIVFFQLLNKLILIIPIVTDFFIDFTIHLCSVKSRQCNLSILAYQKLLKTTF